MEEIDTVVIGAGPHGLAAAAYLRRGGVETRVFGDPMSFWRSMPKGMLLRSNWTATSIAEYSGPLSLDSYCLENERSLDRHVPLEAFIDYGLWVQRKVAPDVDRRRVRSVQQARDGFVLTLDDESQLAARHVVVAAGIAPFAHRPAELAHLPRTAMTHSSEHDDLGVFRGQRVLVVGGGQSALESAALMHESGAEVEVVARADHINWLHGGVYQRRLGRLAPLVYAPTDVGPMGLSRIVAAPRLFRRLPVATQDKMAYRAIRPAGAAWLRPRLEGVPISTGVRVATARPAGDRVQVALDDGSTRAVDHVLLGTGYRVDVRRYPFLDAELTQRIRTTNGYPLLSDSMESSVPGLHFLGAPGAVSFGPVMRFVAGSWYGAAGLSRALTGRRTSRRIGVARPATAGEQL